MTTPTLAQFAKALDAVRRKYPDAPGLPDGYEFNTYYPDGSTVIMCGESITVTYHAALALCVTTATRIADRSKRAAWVEYHSDLDKYRVVVDCQVQDGLYDDDASAALAMLEVIGGGA